MVQTPPNLRSTRTGRERTDGDFDGIEYGSSFATWITRHASRSQGRGRRSLWMFLVAAPSARLVWALRLLTVADAAWERLLTAKVRVGESPYKLSVWLLAPWMPRHAKKLPLSKGKSWEHIKRFARMPLSMCLCVPQPVSSSAANVTIPFQTKVASSEQTVPSCC